LREIGTVPSEKHARTLEDHLLAQKIATKMVEGKNGWVVWVRDEDRVPQATEELRAFLENPDDSRYLSSRESAREIKKAKDRADREYRKRFRNLRDDWEGSAWRRRPATSALIVASVVVAVFTHLGNAFESPVFRALLFSDYSVVFVEFTDGVIPELQFHGLDDISRGQIWRLVTPIFLHFGPLHLVCNMSALWYFGRQIEYEKRKWKFLLLVLIAAIASNFGQYLYDVYAERLTAFGGMSGVCYALFGYVWMKGATRPEERLGVSSNNVFMMMGWFVLCMTGRVGPIANAAHAAGLMVGFLLGATRF
jgi:GlpG protein